MRMTNVAYNHQSSGVADEGMFGGITDPKIAYILFSGLAKDKISYPVREYSTNAWEAGDGDFHLSLPTRFAPTVKWRDKGRGLSHVEIMTGYTKFGASGKDGSDSVFENAVDAEKAVGGWGLGAKSAFAYLISNGGAGSFNVRSFQRGEVRTYVMSLQPGGMPQVQLMDTSPTNEPAGMEVSFAVRREDVETFRARVKSILWFFNPRPTLDGDDAATFWGKDEILAKGTDWTEYKQGTVPITTAHIRMGCVGYPIAFDQLDHVDAMQLKNRPVVIDVPIGSIKVTASREELQYDDTTKATVIAAIKKYETEWLESFRSQFDKYPTLMEAASAMYKTIMDHSFDYQRREYVEARVLKWKDGRTLSHRLVFPRTVNVCLTGINSQHRPVSQRFNSDGHSVAVNKIVADTKVLVDCRPSGAIDRMVALKLPAGTNIMWIRADTPSEILPVLDEWGIAYTRLDTVQVKEKQQLFYYMTPGGSRVSRARFDETEAHYYINIDHRGRSRYEGGWQPSIHGLDWNKIQSLMALTPHITRLIGITEGQTVPDAFKPFLPEVAPLLEAKIDWTYVRHVATSDGPLRHHVSQITRQSDIRWPQDILNVAGDIRTFLEKEKVGEPNDNHRYKPLYDAVMRHNKAAKNYTTVTDEGIQDRINAIFDKYPALTPLLDYFGRSSGHYSSANRSKAVAGFNDYFQNRRS